MTEAVDSKWIVTPVATENPALRLFCFPVAGGGAASFLPWSEHVPSQIQLCAVRLPGRESRRRESPFVAMTTLVTALREHLEPFFDRPFGLYGHCSGGLVAFELARELRRHGGPMPMGLLVSAQGAPQVRPASERSLSSLTRPELVDWLRQVGGTSEEVLRSTELMELIEPAIRADFAVLDSYRYVREAPLEVPISVFGGQSDDTVGLEPLVEWRRQTSQSFVLHLLPAGHLLGGATWGALAQAITDDLLGWILRHIGGEFP